MTMTPDARPVPPEVVLDHCGRQVPARTADGRLFSRYVPCEGGCGFAIGVGDAVDTAVHNSCEDRMRSDGEENGGG